MHKLQGHKTKSCKQYKMDVKSRSFPVAICTLEKYLMLEDIFIEFIKIKEEKYEKSPDEFIRRSAIIRFVTIIEQICRIVIEKQIKEKKYKKNRDETIIVKLQDLENINDINLGFLISASYNFQNIKNIINTLKDYEILRKEIKIS